MNTLKLILVAILFVFPGLFMVGCNTVEGAGEDIEAAGEGIQKGAEEVKEEIKD